MLPALTAKKSRGLPELPPGLGRVPVGLGQDRHAKAGRLQHPPQQGHGKAGVVDVRVAGDEDDVDTVPATSAHLVRRHGQRLDG